MLNCCVIISLGLVISAIAPNSDAASALSAPFLIIGILFGGFYIRVSSLPIILDWIPYISSFRWTYQALAINEFKGQRFSCNLTPTTQCLYTGEQVLENMSFDGHSTNYAVFGLGMLWIAYLIWLYLLLLVNRFNYTHLGYTGYKFRRYGEEEGEEGDEQSEGANKSYKAINASKYASSRDNHGYEMVVRDTETHNEDPDDNKKEDF